MKFQTQRLVFRQVMPHDYDFIESLMTDPEVMKFISGGKPRTRDQIQEIFNKSMELLKNDPQFFYFLAVEKKSNQPVGNLIMRKPATEEETPGLEVGYSFKTEFWGQGYASESVGGLLQFVLEKFGPTRIVALIDPTHNASRRVLEKLGFNFFGETNYVSPADGQKFISEIYEAFIK